MSRNDGYAKLYWHKDDKISVQATSGGSSDNTEYKMAETTQTGATTATFNGTLKDGYKVGKYALYPYSEKHTLSNEAVTYYLPDSYTYKVEGNIFPKTTEGNTTYPANSICMPMLGTIESSKITFKNIGGVLIIRFNRMPAASGKIVVSADQQLHGSFTVGENKYNEPTISTPTGTTNVNNQVTFNYSGATTNGVGVFYLPVPTGQYTHLKISIDDTKNAEYGNLNVDRADVIAIPVYQGADGSSYSCTYEKDNRKFIDLGLPSGTLWAETNIGADKAADVGNYYAWGETEPQSLNSYSEDSYTTDLSKYTEGTVLNNEDDAAYKNWGDFCRMPTMEELQELQYSCDWTKETQTNSQGSSITGYRVTSSINGKSIFFPVSGYYYNNKLANGRYIYCWSRTFEGNGYASSLVQGYNSSMQAVSCYNGLPVRPVATPK